MDKFIRPQDQSKMDDAIQEAVNEMRTAFVRVKRLEGQLSATCFDEVMPELYQAREFFLVAVRKCKSLLVSGGMVPVEVVDYLAFSNCEIPDLATVDGTHRLVGLRVKILECWFALKRCSEDHPLFLKRKKNFIDSLEIGLEVVKKPMEFEKMYELYADDLSKLRSLLVSYFRKRDQNSYVLEFNNHAKSNFKSRNEVSLLLKEFALFFEYQAIL